VRVAGSNSVHLTVEREKTDAWTHIPGFTFCGMMPWKKTGIEGPMCSGCATWFEQILSICAGRAKERP
jgi:hypothetical protein